MNKVQSYFVNLVLLGVLCLVVEQALYCLLYSDHFFRLMASPVFWGGFSVACFSGLWLLDLQSEKTAHTKAVNSIDDLYYFIFKAPMSMDNPDNLFSRSLNGW